MNRPQVRGTVIILLLRGVLTLFQAITTLNDVTSMEGQGFEFQGWIKPLLYFLIVLGGISIIAAILIALYKRLGLILALIAGVLDIGSFIVVALGGQLSVTAFNLLGLVITLAILYYVWKYLTQEPEKLAFT